MLFEAEILDKGAETYDRDAQRRKQPAQYSFEHERGEPSFPADRGSIGRSGRKETVISAGDVEDFDAAASLSQRADNTPKGHSTPAPRIEVTPFGVSIECNGITMGGG